MRAGKFPVQERMDPRSRWVMWEHILYNLARYKFVCHFLEGHEQVVELGCGAGYGASLMADYAKRIVALDRDQRTIRASRKTNRKSNIEFRVGEAWATGLTDGSADVVVCFDVIEHGSKSDGRALLSEVRRVLRPEGLLYVSTPRKRGDRSYQRQRVHRHEYAFGEFRSLLGEFFGHVFVFSQLDEVIGTGNPLSAWHFVAVCLDPPALSPLRKLRGRKGP